MATPIGKASSIRLASKRAMGFLEMNLSQNETTWSRRWKSWETKGPSTTSLLASHPPADDIATWVLSSPCKSSNMILSTSDLRIKDQYFTASRVPLLDKSLLIRCLLKGI